LAGQQYHKDQEYVNKNARQEAPLFLDGQAIEEVDGFTYLGSIVSKTGGTDKDIQAKINKGCQAWGVKTSAIAQN